jgi:predicted transposase/invertase (TIGR01784 family)
MVMKKVASLRYGVIFKKAFCDPEIFAAFVRDVLNIHIRIDKVETEKSFDPPIGRVASRFDLYAEDKENRIIVDIQHERLFDHYDRFLHYHCAALLEQASGAESYRPQMSVFTLVVLTSGDRHQKDIVTIDFDPKDRDGKPLGEIPHRIVYICPKYADEKTPEACREWMRAIDDSLDGEVEESHYTRPEIHRIFQCIEKDRISPQERARMFDEYAHEKLKQDTEEAAIQKGKELGITEGKELGIREKAEETARNLLSLGTMPDEQIAAVTGLTAERVRELSVS